MNPTALFTAQIDFGSTEFAIAAFLTAALIIVGSGLAIKGLKSAFSKHD